MRIEVYTMVWNEPVWLRRFCEAYSEFADRIFVYDYGCTDSTMAVVSEFPSVEARPAFDRSFQEGGLLVADFTKFKREVWKGSTADWVVVVDTDEWLCHPNVRKHLETTKYDILRATGYNVMGPHTISYRVGLEKWRASFDKTYSKPCVFRPTADFKGCVLLAGGHTFMDSVSGEHVDQLAGDSELLLLHARWLGNINCASLRTREIIQNRSPDECSVRQRNRHPEYPLDALQSKLRLRQLLNPSLPLATILDAHHQLASKTKLDLCKHLHTNNCIVPGTSNSCWDLRALQVFLGVPKRWR